MYLHSHLVWWLVCLSCLVSSKLTFAFRCLLLFLSRRSRHHFKYASESLPFEGESNSSSEISKKGRGKKHFMDQRAAANHKHPRVASPSPPEPKPIGARCSHERRGDSTQSEEQWYRSRAVVSNSEQAEIDRHAFRQANKLLLQHQELIEQQANAIAELQRLNAALADRVEALERGNRR